MTLEVLVARVTARLAAGGDREPRDVIFATIRELGLQVDEASGELVAIAGKPEWRAPEDNYRKSVHVPARRRR